jgi:lipid-A-disaccharide synthase
MKIAISAAETSGDLIGAKLVSALKAQNSDIQIEGMVNPVFAPRPHRW